ncbi:amino acid adenylation domain-containing protein [Micromonospora profundi]|uniref:amino acid adenylation domain-containing protein n=1 Tax=Micromonospora profundi TaxID=1420889 RepID=UPI00365D6FC6
MSEAGTVTLTDAGAIAPFGYELVRTWARTHPESPALVVADRSSDPVSYTELVDRVDALAARLLAGGVVPDQPVAVLLDRSTDSVIAMLAVMAAGGAYCPLDVTAPAARLAAVVGALGAGVAVAERADAHRLPPGLTIVPPSGPAVDPLPAASPCPDALAYIMHTSGSTGRPKGVAMTHRGLARLLRWQVGDGQPGLRTLQFTATSFDVTFQEVLSTLATGGCLVVAPEEIRRDPAALLDAIVEHRIQRLFLPYVALQLMAVTAQRRQVVPDSLEHVVTAGERLIITPAIRALFAAIPQCRLDNHYGPTEAHLVTSLTLPADAAGWPVVPSIGAAVDEVVCRVLDEKLAGVADGDTGELYVGGSGLARGYHGDSALTAERFVADPFAPTPGGRLYRTGDLVRARADGGFDFVGRTDTQLKVRGFRVEPAEVENALLSHPRVDAAAVGLREVADGVPVLVAYLQTDGQVTQREITDHVRGQLPPYMVPTRCVPVERLPRTGSGKVDTLALASLDLPDPTGPRPPEAPSLTELITSIWVRVLGHDEFDADDDFFDVGGDSLLATWVVTELEQELGRTVELSVFLDYSTVEDLAGALGTDATVPEQRPRSSQIVTLRAGPSGRSMYLIHPLGGELLGYRELARASRAPLRLLGIGWQGEPPAFGSSLAEIARVHVEQLRIIERDGPYRLAGWSFGGVLAYEMAQQLTAAGGEVEFLALLDANPVIDPITGLPMDRTPFLDMLDSVLARLDDPASTEADIEELTSGQTWTQLMGAPVRGASSGGYLRTALQTARSCMNAAMRYEPAPYAGPVHLFQAAGSDDERQARLAEAMRGLCPGSLTVIPISGDHWGFIRGEHVAEAARELDSALQRVGRVGSMTDGS